MELNRRTFAIDACLGRGGFGEVYRAEMTSSTGLSTAVALKVLRRDLDPGGQAVQRLKDEARALARLNHPAILRVHDLVLLDGRVALITEYVDGEDLERCLRGAERIGLRALLEVLSQIASALDAAWTSPIGEDGAPLKLVHRDVKPSNIRLGRHGEVKLLDFGIARTDEVTREARTQTDMMVGSPPYMAPERFLDAISRPASDVFALGCVLVESLIGRRVFDVPVTVLAGLAVDDERFEAHVRSRLAEIPAETPRAVVALAAELLRHQPSERPTATAVAARMDALVDEIDGPTLARYCRDRRWRDPPREVGELIGKVVTEGTLERPTTPIPRDGESALATLVPEPPEARADGARARADRPDGDPARRALRAAEPAARGAQGDPGRPDGRSGRRADPRAIGAEATLIDPTPSTLSRSGALVWLGGAGVLSGLVGAGAVVLVLGLAALLVALSPDLLGSGPAAGEGPSLAAPGSAAGRDPAVPPGQDPDRSSASRPADPAGDPAGEPPAEVSPGDPTAPPDGSASPESPPSGSSSGSPPGSAPSDPGAARDPARTGSGDRAGSAGPGPSGPGPSGSGPSGSGPSGSGPSGSGPTGSGRPSPIEPGSEGVEEPAPGPAPTPPTAPSGGLVTVRITGVETARITVDGAPVSAPTRLRPGTYPLQVGFADGFVLETQIVVPSASADGQPLASFELACSPRMRKCR